MAENNRTFLKLPTSPLSRRIVFWVFVSVIVIETIILIPSLENRKQELLAHLRDLSLARISVLLLSDGGGDGDALLAKVAVLDRFPEILGGAVYLASGEQVGAFGSAPDLMPKGVLPGEVMILTAEEGGCYDVVWPAGMLETDHALVIRHDASAVKAELFAFALRIAGLVLIISVVVTGGAWIALDPIVVTPILKLRNDLISAGEAVAGGKRTPAFHSAFIRREDELGEVIDAFRRMFRQISDEITERRRAERTLSVSLRQVEAYSSALNKELEQGRLMQKNFLPQQLPEKQGWEIAPLFEPARQVAGDFYDVFELPDGRMGLVIADVCDKGVGAALFMALFRSLIRIFSGAARKEADFINPGLRDRPSALSAVARTNDYIARHHGETGMFATLFFAVLDPVTGQLNYINGGHEPPLVIGEGGIKKSLAPTGPAVGVMEGVVFGIGEYRFGEGEILLGFTDGITDARSPYGEMFSRKRLNRLCEEPFQSAGALLEAVREALVRHMDDAPQDDDITMLAVGRRPGENSRNPQPAFLKVTGGAKG